MVRLDHLTIPVLILQPDHHVRCAAEIGQEVSALGAFRSLALCEQESQPFARKAGQTPQRASRNVAPV
jgi:hypothetical protein